ncbi:hypothetical protein CPZ20_14205 [Lacticaseibacillus rhamnosus]|nr:hypothetical protein CPZ20_14205 [Lacticaseibacillus rhamnosus]PCL35624.1 hypothetical protein CPZ19_14305 [Lacticaseibacillus rhamnosus]PCL38523.1 hypothetical protein CPZ11_14330 [Lacticaseibacillus rhamnosus]PCL41427.1 hypothetical protein CPZ10_14315 [Lacticaseibacillus rhamnosus]
MFKQSKISYIKLSKLYNLTLNPETSWCEHKIRVVTKTNSEKNGVAPSELKILCQFRAIFA